MLKLVPGISASRKNSLITGLARIDENSDELILSAYHLPEPTDFLDVKKATYFAWYYDSQKKSWGKIGELHQKNNLTYSLKKHITVQGSGVFITVEKKGEEPKEPGEIIISSDPELFYKELDNYSEPEVSLPSKKEYPDTSMIKENQIEYQSEDYDSYNQAIEYAYSEANEAKTDLSLPKKRNPNDLKDLFYDLYSDLPVNEVVGLVKNRYLMLKEEVDLSSYWTKCKEYAAELSKDLELDELWEEIKVDFKKIIQKIDLENLWDKVEDLIKDLVAAIDLKEWIQTIKQWLKNLDIHEYYTKLKMYLNAILEKVPLEELWIKVKSWLERLLEQMDIEEIMIWIKIKIRQMRQMSADEMKQEIQNLCKQFIDELNMPEIKIALVKVTVKDKFNQVGNFFKQIKEKMTKEDSLPPNNSNNATSYVGDGQKNYGREQRKNFHNPFPNRRQAAANSPLKPFAEQPFSYPSAEYKHNPGVAENEQSGYSRPSSHQMYQHPFPYQPVYGYNLPQYYANLRAMSGYYNCPCQSCLENYRQEFKIGADAIGKPRYFYDQEDGNYYFLNPDGELVKKS